MDFFDTLFVEAVFLGLKAVIAMGVLLVQKATDGFFMSSSQQMVLSWKKLNSSVTRELPKVLKSERTRLTVSFLLWVRIG